MFFIFLDKLFINSYSLIFHQPSDQALGKRYAWTNSFVVNLTRVVCFFFSTDDEVVYTRIKGVMSIFLAIHVYEGSLLNLFMLLSGRGANDLIYSH